VPRSIWKGAISFGLVSIPVRLFPATQDRDVSFHLLHASDHSRIKLHRFCAAEEVEVAPEDLVRAYEVRPDHYVEISDADLEALPLPARHTIALNAFVQAGEIDPIYYEKSYYVAPEEAGEKAFALLQRVLAERGVSGVATIALRNKESLCALRTTADGLLLETLYYPDEIRARDEAPIKTPVSARELSVAAALVDALAAPFEPDQYQDHYRAALLELIEQKAQGQEVVAPAASEPDSDKVPDLLAALRASITAAQAGRAKTAGQTTETAAPKRKAKRKPAQAA